MAKFTISTTAYEASPIFDLHTSGQNIAAVEISTSRGLHGDKQVFVFETKLDHDLTMTIKKVRGDIEIDLPQGWDLDTGTVDYNDFGIRLPTVVCKRDGKSLLLGYVATPSVTIHFFKEHEVMGCVQ